MKRFLRLAVAIGMAFTIKGCAIYPHGYSAYMLPRLCYVAARTPPMPMRLLKLAEL